MEALDLQGLPSGGDSWTRTNDPIDVNDVLYRLSHATTFRTLGLPVQLDIWTSSSYRLSHATTHRFEVPTKVSYRLSHAIVYINYDGYATYSMMFKPKAKVGLMTAAKIFCQKSREYAKIGIGSQYGLAKISFEILHHLLFCNNS